MPNFRSRNPYPGIPEMPLPPIVPAEPIDIQLEDVDTSDPRLAPMEDFTNPMYYQPSGYHNVRDHLTGDLLLQRLQKMNAPSSYVGTFRGRG